MAENDSKLITLGGLSEFLSKVKENFMGKPSGGTAGQVLTKTQNGESWMDSSAKTTANIIAVGGPVEVDDAKWPTDSGWKTQDNQKQIPSNVSLQTLMEKLFSKDTEYTPAIAYGWPDEISVNPGRPILTKNGSQVSSNISVEAGTIVKFGGCSKTLVDKTYAVQSSGCTNGKVLSLSYDVINRSDWSTGDYSESHTMERDDTEVQLTPSVSGFRKKQGAEFVAYSISTPSETQDIPADADTDIYVNDGENKITVDQSGPNYSPKNSASEYPNDGKYIFAASAQKKYSDSKKVQILAATTYADKESIDAEGSTSSWKITGFRQGFYGSSSPPHDTIDSAVVRGLTPAGVVSAGQVITFNLSSAALEIVIAVPSERTVTKVRNMTSSGSDITSNFTLQANTPVEGANGFTSANYNVYYYKPLSDMGGDLIEITIG